MFALWDKQDSIFCSHMRHVQSVRPLQKYLNLKSVKSETIFSSTFEWVFPRRRYPNQIEDAKLLFGIFPQKMHEDNEIRPHHCQWKVAYLSMSENRLNICSPLSLFLFNIIPLLALVGIVGIRYRNIIVPYSKIQ